MPEGLMQEVNLLQRHLNGIYNFGIRALILILVTIASCVASEWIFNKIVHKKNSINDLSAVVTGLLLASFFVFFSQ